MILYTNGDSHTAGAECVTSFQFAEEDPIYKHLKKQPHPLNLKSSWSQKVADHFDAELICNAESGSSNHRILRTTKEDLDNLSNKHDITDILVIIGWSGWAREEWLIDGEYYQVNNSGNISHTPYNYDDKYKAYIANIDENKCVNFWNHAIQEFSDELQKNNIKHLFFNSFQSLKNANNTLPLKYFIEPYQDEYTYDYYLKKQNIPTKQNFHYGNDGHKVWAKFLINYIQENDIIR